jgi:ER lumen protein retaining receptor
MAIPNLSAQ